MIEKANKGIMKTGKSFGHLLAGLQKVVVRVLLL